VFENTPNKHIKIKKLVIQIVPNNILDEKQICMVAGLFFCFLNDTFDTL